MIEQAPLFEYEPQPELAYIVAIQHGHDGLSFVKIQYKSKEHLVAINTSELSYDEADELCRRVGEWWNEDADSFTIYNPSDITSVDTSLPIQKM